MSDLSVCPVCPHACSLKPGQQGLCKSRYNKDGRVIPKSFGTLTAVALDPIEKKPLARFMPGKKILSVGSFGCNMFCSFCQNHDISQKDESDLYRTEKMTPEELALLALDLSVSDNNIGVAYTYNEPLISFEYVLETSKLIHKALLKNVLVTNGNINRPILEEVLPFIDAMNIDPKVFSDEGYRKFGGDFETVKTFIRTAHERSHVELTTLIVPGLSDSEEDMRKEAAWIADIDPEIVLHITRYFPQYRMSAAPTDINLMRRLKEIADSYLDHVYLGNV